MTVTVAWVRKINDTEELVVASDSRLRFGQAWDACPKLFVTDREDCVLGFAGDTMYSYPIIMQVLNHIKLHRATRTRDTDIYDLKGHLERVIANMLLNISDFPVGEQTYETPTSMFILAGYSWKKRRFVIWKVSYDLTQKKFVWNTPHGLRDVGGENFLAVIADPSMSQAQRRKIEKSGKIPPIAESDDLKIIVNERIAKYLQSKGGLNGKSLNMEPFEVLRDLLREKVSPHIGGSIQMVKIYPSCCSQQFGVLWPKKRARKVSVCGRPLLEYERLDVPVIDPDSLECGINLWPKPKRKRKVA